MKKYVSREDWNDAYNPRKAQKTRLEPPKDTIDAWILEDLKKKRNSDEQRRKYTKICARTSD
ncbi:hypothetical protein FACS1894105_11380 [Clostridia bacterium]|nr:hypothetical protein FACS1894105_11380 [Clostridia bacterium]